MALFADHPAQGLDDGPGVVALLKRAHSAIQTYLYNERCNPATATPKDRQCLR
jgi:hypothetical protein